MLSFLQILKIYFQTTPFIIGELILLIGIGNAISNFPKDESYFSIIFFIIAGFILFKKFNNTVKAKKILEFGKSTEAVLLFINDTNAEHNSRTVKSYSFSYYVNNVNYYYDYNSAYHRSLFKGQRILLFYNPQNPEESFIPELFGIDGKQFLK